MSEMVELVNYETQAKVGKRLKEARETKGLCLEDVSKQIKVPESVIAQIEDGRIQGHFKEIYGMLCIYSTPVHYIFKDVFYSDYSVENAENDDSVSFVLDIIRFHKRLREKHSLLSSVPLARGKVNGKPTSLSTTSTFKSKKSLKKAVPSVLESRAKEVINTHRLYKLPINIYQVAANLQISVSFESLPSDLYMKLRGFCYKEDGFSLIGINKSHPIYLQRFTMAHELHHFLFDFNSSQFLCGPDNASEAFEWNAECFAAELLMPRDFLHKLTSNPLNVSYLTINLVAQHFGVSYEAAAIRLNNFGLVSNVSEVCGQTYRRKDKQKTEYLLQNKRKYLAAVFGLETGITELQLHSEVKRHDLCGAAITDPSHTMCWNCGLELEKPSSKDYCLKTPHRQNPFNLNRALSLEQGRKLKEQEDYRQLSMNLDATKK